MRFKYNRPPKRDTLLLSGWLFADLFLALAVIFLSANTGGITLLATVTPTPTPTVIPTPTVAPTPMPMPSPTVTPTPAPRLELAKHRVTLPNIDTAGLLNDTQSAITDLQNQVKSQSFLNQRTVGLVIVYGGAPDDTQIARAQNVSNKVMDALRSLGRTDAGFARTSYYDPLYTLGNGVDIVVIDIYLFY